MHKNFQKSFENERKIEQRSFDTERESKAAEKLSASGAQNFRLSAIASNFFERTKALVTSIFLSRGSISSVPSLPIDI